MSKYVVILALEIKHLGNVSFGDFYVWISDILTNEELPHPPYDNLWIFLKLWDNAWSIPLFGRGILFYCRNTKVYID